MAGGIGSISGIDHVNIKPDLRVLVVLKPDQRSGKLTEGKVKDILTRSAAHPRSIKVRLENGMIGRVIEIKP
ncbi:YwbE family protein [Chloroflexota bacterium]